ncbi:MAG: 30S ribosomal protein S4 [Candidatus Roizmanbacteria bacterium]
MRYTGPRNRLARREGIDLGLKTLGSKAQAGLLKRLNITPGQHGRSRKAKLTDYGVQLREKQKIKRMYGLSEKKLKSYFKHASSMEGNTAELLIQGVEKRLDNVLYRLQFAPTRASARQLVSHGHILVNGKKVSIPSYQVSEKDMIGFKKESSTKIPYIEVMVEKKDATVPSWLERKAKSTGLVLSMPLFELFKEDINLQAVVEFYSR